MSDRERFDVISTNRSGSRSQSSLGEDVSVDGVSTESSANNITFLEIDSPDSAEVGGSFEVAGLVETTISAFSPVQSIDSAVIADTETESDLVIDRLGEMRDGDTAQFRLVIDSGDIVDRTIDVSLQAQHKAVIGGWDTKSEEILNVSVVQESDDGGDDDGGSDDGDNESRSRDDDGGGIVAAWNSLSSDQKLLVGAGAALGFLALSSDDSGGSGRGGF